MKKQKILISACLLGCKVKYNGQDNKLDNLFIDKLKSRYEIFSFCPEVEGGLPTPRIPCEITKDRKLKVISKENIDKTKEFISGADKTLILCKKENIKLALLKANSPSCSSEFIYDGTFSNTKIKGDGVTTKLLKQNGINVVDELDFSLVNDTTPTFLSRS